MEVCGWEEWDGRFLFTFIPCREQLSSSIRETVRYKLQPCFRLTAHIIIFSDSKAALFFILARGLRFCLSPKEVDKYDVKCSFKLLHRGLIKLDENHDQLKRNRTKPKSIRKNTL